MIFCLSLVFLKKNQKTLKTIFSCFLNFLFSLTLFLKLLSKSNVKHPYLFLGNNFLFLKIENYFLVIMPNKPNILLFSEFSVFFNVVFKKCSQWTMPNNLVFIEQFSIFKDGNYFLVIMPNRPLLYLLIFLGIDIRSNLIPFLYYLVGNWNQNKVIIKMSFVND